MNLLDQIRQWKNKKPAYHPAPETDALREALEAGQRAKRAEDYTRALEALNSAMNLAHTAQDSTAIAVIALNQAEVYIQLRAWDEAEQLLQRTYQNARDINQKTQMAYLLSAQGMLAQARGDWSGAQHLYEQALQTARGAGAVGAEGRALGLLAETYLHEANASYASHLLREALPKLNMTGDIELSSSFVGLLGEALIASGHESEGGQLLDRALRLARQMGYRIYERQWSLALGKRDMAAGRINEAYAHLLNVLKLANLNNPSVETVEVLCLLSKVCLNLHEEAEALEHATEAVDLSQSFDDPALVARARGALGIVLLTTGSPADAVPHLQAASDFFITSPAVDAEFSQIDILRNLAAAYADTDADDAAVATYQQALNQAQAQDARLELAQVRRDLGLFFSRRHKLHDAIREWMAAVAIYDNEHQPAQVARLLCDIGSARRFLGQGQRAIKDFEQALMTLNMINDDWETRGLVLSNAANMYVDQGDIESAEAFFNESIAIARRLNNQAAEATRRGNYGWFLLSTGKPQQAIAALEYALRISQSLHSHLQIAIQINNLGSAYDMLGNYPRALEYHQQALDSIQPFNNPHWENIFKVTMSHTLMNLGQTDRAEPLLRQVLEVARSQEDVEVIARALTGIGRIAVLQGNPTEALPALEEAVNLARRADMRHILAEALSVYSQQQAALQQIERSGSLWDEAQRLFQMLHSPQARVQPTWLHLEPTEQIE